MTACELIGELTRLVADHGDSVVYLSARQDGDTPVTVRDVAELYQGSGVIFIRDHIPGEPDGPG